MDKHHFQSESTKFEAYRLVHDPTRLFKLLFLKYGDITEDFNIFLSNQILFNNYSHFNTLYKEHLRNSYEEFIKRFYKYKEIAKRIIKLNEYYKNYLKFFSKPMFVNSFHNKLVNHYYDSKAEIFYVNNLTQRKSSKNNYDKKTNNNGENSNLSSIDNDTENDVIFNKRIKNMIDHNLNTNSYTLTLNINTKNDLNYISKKNISNSFEKIVNNIVNYKNNQNNKNVDNSNIINDEMKSNLKKNINLIGDKIIKENNCINCINKNRISIDSKSNEKEKIVINKDKISKIKEHQIKFIFNKNIIENNDINNNVEKIQEKNLNYINKYLPIQLIKQKNINPLNNHEQKIREKKIITKKLFKKNLCLGLNLNVYKNPLNKIKNINFYSPQNSKEKRTIFNKIFTPINYNKYKLNKALHNSQISDQNINPGFVSINIKSSGKRIFNKKIKLFSKNLKNDIQKIKINIDRQNNLNILSIKNNQIKSPQNKRNKSTHNLKNTNNLTLKELNHNLSGEKILNMNNKGKIALNTPKNKTKEIFTIQNKFIKKLSPSFLRNKEELKRENNGNDTYKNFEGKTSLNSILEQNFSKNNEKMKNKFINKDSKKLGGNNTNINGKKKFFPINFKKFFNKKDNIKDKDMKLGLNFI